ncbi:hypothetical protein MNBD_GAMMA11-2167 [hydrothermal vent metagenome]|uniref:Uncharacterized protein n=1 Tax=hydrothermal vent metagenome TaxID=652676 RepID=A0A3B0XJE7_9ZZZZ
MAQVVPEWRQIEAENVSIHVYETHFLTKSWRH